MHALIGVQACDPFLEFQNFLLYVLDDIVIADIHQETVDMNDEHFMFRSVSSG